MVLRAAFSVLTRSSDFLPPKIQVNSNNSSAIPATMMKILFLLMGV
jgi:hypothetical protein